MRPKYNQSYEYWMDADFTRGFDHKIAGNDPTTSKSRSGWVITYMGCPVTWSSKLQTLTALSMMEAEYIALSMACHDLIPMMERSGMLKSLILGSDQNFEIKVLVTHPWTPVHDSRIQVLESDFSL